MALPVNPDERFDKKRELVQEAAGLFDRDGYHAVNVGMLARAVGLSKPTLYHYFNSKDEILFLIHEEFIDLLLQRAGERTPSLSASDALREYFIDVLELIKTHRGHVRVFFEHYRELSRTHQDTIREKRDRYHNLVQNVIEAGISSGEFRTVDAGVATMAFFGMCNWTYQWFRPDGPLSAAEIAAQFADLLLGGLRSTNPSMSV